MAVLVTGGAGYIGSHVVAYFQEQKKEIIVVDNLSTGHRDDVKDCPFYLCDVRDIKKLDEVFKLHQIDAVIHFAANSIVPESMKHPYEYYHNNVFGMMSLLKVMQTNQVTKLIFSSSAAVYGEPAQIPIQEEDATLPTNPYGETKMAMERMMKWFDSAYGIRYIALRYFNASGAHNKRKLGERHNPETHLIPLILQSALGIKDFVCLYGDDYPTKDGTCIRDFVHVQDLASAHYLALQYLLTNGKSDIFNLGNGDGVSVKEVIESCRKITGSSFHVKTLPRREGDPAILVASSEKAKNLLGWNPQNSNIDKIVSDAWNFMTNE
jgi:UDP-glucose 4-epimerase